VTVMRRGKIVGTSAASKLTKEDLARQMVGREVLFTSRRQPQEPGEIVFHAQGLNCSDTEHRARLHDATVEVRAGEIVGVAGVEGNGQFELVNAIMGLAPMTSGTLEVKGKDITHADILTRRTLIAFVPQDRGKMGASLAASILEDAIMTHHILDPRFRTWRGLGLNYRHAAEFVDQIRDQFTVSMGHSSDPFHSLSGGNQQKVILGRELLLETPFVLMDQPTRGLDVGSIEYVHQLLLDLRSKKRAVLLISADLDELFMVADRIVVMCQGEVVADLVTDATSREEIGYYMLGGKEAAHAETGS